MSYILYMYSTVSGMGLSVSYQFLPANTHFLDTKSASIFSLCMRRFVVIRVTHVSLRLFTYEPQFILCCEFDYNAVWPVNIFTKLHCIFITKSSEFKFPMEICAFDAVEVWIKWSFKKPLNFMQAVLYCIYCLCTMYDVTTANQN